MRTILITLLILNLTTMLSAQPKTTLSVVTTTPEPVGNISFNEKGQMIYSNHPLYNPKYNIELWDDLKKTASPYPNAEWNTPNDKNDWFLSSVLGLRNDPNGIMWFIDMANHEDITQKIVGWNMRTNKLERIYYLPKVTTNSHSQPNDMLVDTKHKVFIIADEGSGNEGDGSTGAFIVVDMITGKTQRLLEGHYSTMAANVPMIIDGTLTLKHKNGDLVKIGNDGITADKDFEWLYYGPINGHELYRIKIEDLLNEKLTDAQLGTKVEKYSQKPNNGGLSIDVDGNIYTTAVEDRSVYVILAKDRSLHKYCSDDRMIWADGLSYNHVDGYMYVSASQIYLAGPANDGVDKTIKPYYTFKFKPIAEGVAYR